MIVYKEIKNTNQEIIQVGVYVENRRIGSIEKEVGGWRYVPKGQSFGGELMGSIALVKMSLESE